MITSLINRIFNNKDNIRDKRLNEIKGLPADKLQKQLGGYLFDLCVHRALSFVTEEFSRAESPFRAVDKLKLFHEILAVNFWLVDRELSKVNGAMIAEIHELYRRAYGGSGEHYISAESLRDRYNAYHDLWDDVAGHQDRFGRKVSEAIFGDVSSVPVEQTSFWIITHAHDAAENISCAGKLCGTGMETRRK